MQCEGARVLGARPGDQVRARPRRRSLGVVVATYLGAWALVLLADVALYWASSPVAPHCDSLCFSPRANVGFMSVLVALFTVPGHVIAAGVAYVWADRRFPAVRGGVVAFLVSVLVTALALALTWRG